MNRLTAKVENGYKSTCIPDDYFPTDSFARAKLLDDTWERERNKLGQLEDIEEKRDLRLIFIDKALEIIAKKRVDLASLFFAIHHYGKYALEQYNIVYYSQIVINGVEQLNRALSQEEFDLLKEVIKKYAK